MQRGLVGILAMMTAACSSPPVTGTVAGGLTGNPVKGLRLLARAGEGASMTCQADEAQTDENGTFTFSRMCPGVTYKLSDADKQLMFQGADGVSIEANKKTPVEVTAWWMPKGNGVYRMGPDGRKALRAQVELGTELVGEESVVYPKTLPARLQAVEKGSWLVLAGTLADDISFAPLIESEEREWYYVGVKFTGDTLERIASNPDASKVTKKTAGDRQVLYVPSDALPEGRYVLTQDGATKVRLVDFGKSFNVKHSAKPEEG